MFKDSKEDYSVVFYRVHVKLKTSKTNLQKEYKLNRKYDDG